MFKIIDIFKKIDKIIQMYFDLAYIMLILAIIEIVAGVTIAQWLR